VIPLKRLLPTVKTYPIDYNIVCTRITFALTTIISGLFPALKASKVDPVEIIRGK
jgi:lipoprotein-releasing system permease protein